MLGAGIYRRAQSDYGGLGGSVGVGNAAAVFANTCYVWVGIV